MRKNPKFFVHVPNEETYKRLRVNALITVNQLGVHRILKKCHNQHLLVRKYRKPSNVTLLNGTMGEQYREGDF